ncbi:MAG: class I SAM-dependent methyltransferase [Candidatus Bipolaricaulia bacterium]
MKQDWVHQMFIEHGDLFIEFLEARIDQAAEEIQGLLPIFDEFDIESGSQVLDLSCGIGRHSVELAKHGYRVTGVDISPLFIHRANELAKQRKVQSRTEFQVVDVRKLKGSLSAGTFDAIINLFTSFGYYDDETNQDILKSCRELVRDRGIFVMEIINRDWLVRNFQPRGFDRLGAVLILQERWLDLEDSRMYNTWTFLEKQDDKTYGQRAEIKLDHQVHSLHELIAIFERAGWRYQSAYGSLELDEPSIDTQRLVVVVQAG